MSPENSFSICRLNLNLIIRKKITRKIARFVDDALKTRGIKYLNIGTWLLFDPTYQNFSLRAWLQAHSWCLNKVTIDKDPHTQQTSDVCKLHQIGCSAYQLESR